MECLFCNLEKCECPETSERRKSQGLTLVSSLACVEGNGSLTTNGIPLELKPLATSIGRVDQGKLVADPDHPRAVMVGQAGVYAMLTQMPAASIEVSRYIGEDLDPFSELARVLEEDFGRVEVGVLEDGDMVFAIDGGVVVCGERREDVTSEDLCRTAKGATAAGLMPPTAIPNGIEIYMPDCDL